MTAGAGGWLRELVRFRLGIAVPDARVAELERAAVRAAAEAGLPGVEALRAVLGGGSAQEGSAQEAVLDAVVSGLNLGETYFFRDAGQMAALEQRILPELIALRRPERRLRVWSAGCSTGEEPYTVAILLHRLLPDLAGWDARVLGTDVNGRSLRQARRGVYRAWSLRGLDAAAAGPHLAASGPDVEVSAAVRAMVTFARLNLVGEPSLYPVGAGAVDLVLCRNVLLYFDEAAARQVVCRLRDALRPGGWLLLNPVEAGLAAVDGLERSDLDPAAFRRSCERAVAAPAPDPVALPAAGPPSPQRPETAGRPTVGRPGRARVPRPGPAGAGRLVPGLVGGDRVGAAPSGACARALRLWQDGDRDAALGLLEREAARSPLAAEVHFLHGLILLAGRRPSDALGAFRRCTYAEPGYVLGHLGQAGAFTRVGQPGRARAAVEHAAWLVAELKPDAVDLSASAPAFPGPAPAELLELIAAHRQLLGLPPATGAGP